MLSTQDIRVRSLCAPHNFSYMWTTALNWQVWVSKWVPICVCGYNNYFEVLQGFCQHYTVLFTVVLLCELCLASFKTNDHTNFFFSSDNNCCYKCVQDNLIGKSSIFGCLQPNSQNYHKCLETSLIFWDFLICSKCSLLQAFELPDTLQSWFSILHLHIWWVSPHHYSLRF